jgi:hypothetical protein
MKLAFTIATTTAPLANGITFAGLNVSLSDTAGNPVNDSNGAVLVPVSLATAPYVASFSNVPDGDYVATATAVDTTGAVIGTPITQAFTLTTTSSGPVVSLPTPPVATFDSPVSISVTVS